MPVEVRCIGRPRLPKYFPPGYWRDWHLWLMIFCNVAALGMNGYLAWEHRGGGWSLLINCAGLAFTVYALPMCIRTIARHSRQWRQVERPALEALHAEIEADMHRMADEFARFYVEQQKKQQGGNDGH